MLGISPWEVNAPKGILSRTWTTHPIAFLQSWEVALPVRVQGAPSVHDDVLTRVGVLFGAAVFAQWLGWRLHVPAILLLLLAGLVLGPISGFLNPDQLLGGLLFPLISLSVAIILFEGGLSLRFTEIRDSSKVVRNLIILGVPVTWVGATLIGYFGAHLGWGASLLLGSVLTVSGPTVVGPLLRHIRPRKRVSGVLKWESILVDPVGATLAVLVFVGLLSGSPEGAAASAALSFFKTVAAGAIGGIVGAAVIVSFLRRYWVPDYLQEVATLVLVVGVFVLTDLVARDSGLLAVTVMGIALANQSRVSVRHIVEFKENLRILLLSVLFVVLAARVGLSDLRADLVPALMVSAVLVLAVRPAVVFASSLGSPLSIQERAFAAWLAPRGIVAAGSAAAFALELGGRGFAGMPRVAPIVFLVIGFTVAIYGFTGPVAARLLRVADINPQGVLFMGAHRWARDMALFLKSKGFEIMMLDTNYGNLSAAWKSGLSARFVSTLLDYVLDDVDLGGIGRLVAVTSNDAVNTLAANHFVEEFGSAEVYQLAPEQFEFNHSSPPPRHRGRTLFAPQVTHSAISRLFESGATLAEVPVSSGRDWESVRQQLGTQAIPLFIIRKGKVLDVFCADGAPVPERGDTVVVLGSESAAPARGEVESRRRMSVAT